MISNYVKIALRNSKKNKLYSAISLFGLTLSLTCTMLILIYLRYETSYDRYHATCLVAQLQHAGGGHARRKSEASHQYGH